MDREPVFLEDVLTFEQIQELKQAIEADNLEAFRTFFESEEFPLLPEDALDDIPLTFLTLGASRSSGFGYCPNIFMYLLDHGADLNYMTMGTVASVLSPMYFWDEDFEVDVYTTLAINAAVLGNLDVLELLYERGADLELSAENDQEEPIPDHTLLFFVEQQLQDLDRQIDSQIQLLKAYTRTAAREYFIQSTQRSLDQNLIKRIKLVRVLRWVRFITTEENIPAFRPTAKNRKAYQNVLLRAPGLGKLEKKYLMSFVPKPAKFAIQPEHGFKRVNTSLFQGGRTRKRKQTQQRKTRNRK